VTAVRPGPRVLVVRNDRLGDFLLAWPAFALLKASAPATRVVALVPAYTGPLAALCPWIDDTLLDPAPGGGIGSVPELAREFRAWRLDAMIALFSTARVGAAAWWARVPRRLGPATKVAQLFLNRRVLQRRSRSVKPEYEYNLDLVRAYLGELGVEPRPVPPPFLAFPPEEVAGARTDFCRREGLDPATALVLVHPGSGGSAPGLGPFALARFAAGLRSARGHAIVVTAGPEERAVAEQVAGAVGEAAPVRVYHSTSGLPAFARFVAAADVFVSNSTGPLHLAGAMDRPTVAFYPRTPVMSGVRWRTLNSPERTLGFAPPKGAGPEEMEKIDLAAAAAEVSRRWLGAAGAADGVAGS
jgi:ADP-heptose:LPS heptosyltransferase